MADAPPPTDSGSRGIGLNAVEAPPQESPAMRHLLTAALREADRDTARRS